MIHKTSSSFVAAVAAFSLLAPSPRAEETNYGQIAMHVAYMLQNHHYSHRDFDDEMSKDMLANFIDLLDFGHKYFTQADVDSFKEKYDSTLDDHVLMRNISPAIEIYDVYKKRVEERVAFVKNALKTNKFTFDSNRTVQMKRDKEPWPKDKAAADKLWLDIVEENLLQERIADEARIREEKKKAEKATQKKDAPKSADAKKEEAPGKVAVPTTNPEIKVVAKDTKKEKDEKDMTPEERVAKDYDRLLEITNENEQDDVVNYFLSSLATAYDPHTEYMNVDERDSFNQHMTHKLVGIGALLATKEEAAEIQGIVVGGPADKEGSLKLNDRIIAVAQGDEEFVDVKYLKLQKIVSMIRGEKGTVARLKVVPADDPSGTVVISITRDEVPLKEKLANAELLVTPEENGKQMKLGWINLSNFYGDMERGEVSASADVERLLRRLIKENIDGLVFDLRDNGGGSLDEAIKLTGLFVPSGPVVQAKDWRGSISWKDSEEPKALYDGPMIVLTNKASASASEILAAALQDYRRALIVGDKSSFGKGTVQTILDVARYMPFFSKKDRAGSLKVTIQKFYRIAGGSTQLKGVVPDIILPSRYDVLDIGEDAAKNPLPYDTIPSRKFSLARPDPFPLDELRARVKSRIDANPEFQLIVEDSKRLKERIDKNTLVLNLAEREKERLEAEARRDKVNEDRAKRAKEVADRIKDNGFKVYRLTLDNVDQEKLVLEADFTKEQNTGMRTAKKDEDEEDNLTDGSKFPYGLEPLKLEAAHIMRDLIDLERRPTTADKGAAKPAGVPAAPKPQAQ
ncbi:MAG: carboxy terminal-processing peptidase [Verrucomicrobiaceae bacterium]|nr:carboxy terminal-processing peptidase [Verrucomicrobiaceae bacterium]